MEQNTLWNLIGEMSLEEKIDQMVQLMGFFYLSDQTEVITGPITEMGILEKDVNMMGSILGTYDAKSLIRLQKEYMEKQPHHIPMLFMMDIIHGMSTVFQTPIGQGATFDPDSYEKCMAVSAKEAAVSGLHVTFAPMADLVWDCRWGRVVESTGEDPYLNGKMAAAAVRGFQGENMKEPYHICACVKHFAGYGGAQGGRDYNTVEVSEHTFRDFHLKAYKEAIDSGVGMVMTSFNTIDGIPATINRHLMRDILRGEMGFTGVLISDHTAVPETIAHGCAKDKRDAAKKAVEAGVDIDMMSNTYVSSLKNLIEKKELDEKLIDEAVFRILDLKNKLGLFENPYKDADIEKEKRIQLCEEHRALARENAAKSFVLLKNDPIEQGDGRKEPLLPVSLNKKTVFIGPYTCNHEMYGSWAVTGDCKDSITIQEAAQKVFDSTRTVYLQGCGVLDKEDKLAGFPEYIPSDYSEETILKMMEEAVTAAKAADIVIMPVGEHYLQTGEATSRANITIPDRQMELIRRAAAVNPNIVVVLFNGRPLDLREVSRYAKTILEVWLPGTEAGSAIVDVLTGKTSPQGKLPISFPYCVGQVPIMYNEFSTGRPNTPGTEERFKSKYIDIPNEPLYCFGYGLSYTSFSISEVRLSAEILNMEGDDEITASAEICNTGETAGTETLQLYIQDVTASVVRPVKELMGFQKVTLQPGESSTISFTVNEEMLRFTREDYSYGSEPGEFKLWIGNSSNTDNSTRFVLQ